MNEEGYCYQTFEEAQNSGENYTIDQIDWSYDWENCLANFDQQSDSFWSDSMSGEVSTIYSQSNILRVDPWLEGLGHLYSNTQYHQTNLGSPVKMANGRVTVSIVPNLPNQQKTFREKVSEGVHWSHVHQQWILPHDYALLYPKSEYE
jgi:hypothetical protein